MVGGWGHTRGMHLPDDIMAYHARLSDDDRAIAEVDVAALRAWLAESRAIQWDYEHIRTNRGLVKLTDF